MAERTRNECLEAKTPPMSSFAVVPMSVRERLTDIVKHMPKTMVPPASLTYEWHLHIYQVAPTSACIAQPGTTTVNLVPGPIATTCKVTAWRIGSAPTIGVGLTTGHW